MVLVVSIVPDTTALRTVRRLLHAPVADTLVREPLRALTLNLNALRTLRQLISAFTAATVPLTRRAAASSRQISRVGSINYIWAALYAYFAMLVFILSHARLPTGNYGYYESCYIYVTSATTLDVQSFSTESSYDYVTVNSISYSGSYSPDGVAVSAGNYIYFSSDSSISYSGFEICAEGTTSSDDDIDDDNDDNFNDDDGSSSVGGIIAAIMFPLFGLALCIAALCIIAKLVQLSNRANQVTTPEDEEPSPHPPQTAVPSVASRVLGKQVQMMPFQPQPAQPVVIPGSIQVVAPAEPQTYVVTAVNVSDQDSAQVITATVVN